MLGRLFRRRPRPALVLELPAATARRLESLRSLAERRSRAEVVALALALFELAMRERAAGGRLLLEDPAGTVREVSL